MKVWYDRGADALYIRLNDAPIIESEEVRPGVVLDFDDNDRVVGVEVMHAGKVMSPDQLEELERAA
ncbi:MAG TPA: DUF2283 domain-containing protein [Skermanella sp.]|jgi:uncharacterized protein YuzE|nr:DUF2283 domain-containing protein [Skermanella sp.]